jgi:integrase/recombinase XerC
MNLEGLLAAFARDNRLLAQPAQGGRTVRIIRELAAAVRPREVLAATPQDVVAYLAGLRSAGRTQKTAQNAKYALSAFFNWAGRAALTRDNPCRLVRMRRPDRPPPPVLIATTLEQLLAAADAAGVGPAVRLAVGTGLRLSELCRLRWEDVDLAGRALRVQKSKSGEPRIVPISTLAAAALASQQAISGGLVHVFPARKCGRGYSHLVDKPVGVDSMLRALAPVRAAVPEFKLLAGRRVGRGWHLLRHEFATRLCEADVNLIKIADWMGHSSTEMTRRYVRLRRHYDPDIESVTKGRP